jgi:adenosylcobinamide-GDP ribazoletransferase
VIFIAQFAAALAFLTRLPTGQGSAVGAKDVARAARWFPLVGALLGGIYVGVFWLLIRIFPPLVTAAMIVAIDAWITGALHLDGLADTADGFGGGRTRDDVLRIMRDHAIGSYGAIALVLVIAVKIGATAALAEPGRTLAPLFLAPVCGRWSAVFLGSTGTYARPLKDDGPGSVGSPARFIRRSELMIATAVAMAVAALVGRWLGAASFLVVAIASLWWGWRCRCRVEGVTGDTIGAGVEISECLVLLLFIAIH